VGDLIALAVGLCVIALVVSAYVAGVIMLAVFVGPFLVVGTAVALTVLVLDMYLRVAIGVMFRPSSPYRGALAFPPEQEPEPAFRQYFFGPALRDLDRILRVGRQECVARGRTWARAVNRGCFGGTRVPNWIGVPIGVILWIGLLYGMVLSVALVALLALLHVVFVFVAQFAARVMIGVLRGLDTLLLTARDIRGVTCKQCGWKIRYPSYECGQCNRRHRDIRPGRHGVLRRRCACGRRMPTLLLLGSHRLPPYCAVCDQRMTPGVGLRPEIVVPLFGGRSAGKTRLVAALAMTLLGQAAHGGPPARLADADTQSGYGTLEMILRSAGHVAATRGRPVGYSLYLGAGRGERLVHVFDAAGETFVSSDRTDELEYARYARTALFVVDPMSVPGFLRGLTAGQLAALDLSTASDMPPEDVFARFSQTMVQMQVRTERVRLAVAVSKLDVLRDAGVLQGEPDGAQLEQWLTERLQLGNLIRAMRHEFHEVRFFATASVVGDLDQVDPSIARLAGWLLPRLAAAAPERRRAVARV